MGTLPRRKKAISKAKNIWTRNNIEAVAYKSNKWEMLKETAQRWIICAFNSISVSLPPYRCAGKKMLIWLRRATDSRRGDHTSVLKTSTQSFLIITSCTMDGKFPFFFFFVRVRAQPKPADRTRQVATWEENRKKRTGGGFRWNGRQ